MINSQAITQWAHDHPWQHDEQVEQDLAICRAIIAIFSDSFLASQLAWKGGTALHKLHLLPQVRYSEDIDLVQVVPGPIKPIFERLGEVLSWLPNKSTQQTRYSNKIKYKYISEIEPKMPMRLKVEINCIEHLVQLGLEHRSFSMTNSWFTGSCEVTTYKMNELLCTKFNAIYGRKKLRDLFDMDHALVSGKVNPDEVIRCWRTYREYVNEPPVTAKVFAANMALKLKDPEYLIDMQDFLRPGVSFDPHDAWSRVSTAFLRLI